MEYKKFSDELKVIEEQEKKLTELKEFATYEIGKIDAIKPIVGEDEALNLIKKQIWDPSRMSRGKPLAIYRYVL